MSIPAETTGSNQNPSGDSTGGNLESFSFDSLHSQALSMFEGGTPAAEPATEQAVPSADVEAPVEQEATSVPSQLAQLGDDSLVEVEVDGEKVQMPWSEARGGVMRQSKFTKSMQQLAAEKKALEAEKVSYATAKQERDALVQLLKDEQLLAQFLQKQYPHLTKQQAAEVAAQAQPQSVDPDDIATVGQIRQAQLEMQRNIEHQRELARQEAAELKQSITTDIEDRQAAAKLGLEIKSTITGLFKEHPYIQELIPNAEEMLRHEVFKMRPETHEQVIDAFKQVYGGWVENYQKVVQKTSKQQVIAKQKLVENNIQPPGGAPVQPTATSFMKTSRSGQRDIDWGALHSVAKDMLK